MGDAVAGGGPGRARMQVRLTDLVVAVLAVGLFIGLIRGARFPNWFAGIPETERCLGAGAMAVAIVLAMGLVGQAWGAWRRVVVGPVRFWAVAWRLAAASLLAVFAAEESRLLRFDGEGRHLVDFNRQAFDAALAVLPTAAIVGMAGIVAGLTPRRGGPTRRPRWAIPAVALAAVFGVLVVAVNVTVIPYLVLLAIEAVWQAMHHPDAARLGRNGVHPRLMAVAPEVAAALAVCVAGAAWLSRDLRRPPALEGGRGGPGRAWARLLSGAGPAACGAWLLLSTLGRVHECLADGLAATVGPGLVAAIVLGLAGLAAGLAARAADRPGPGVEASTPPDPRKGAGWRIIGLVARLAVLLALIDLLVELAALSIPAMEDVEWSYARWIGWLRPIYASLTSTSSLPALLLGRLEVVAMAAALVWMGVRSLAGTGYRGGPPAPLDLCVAEPEARGRFLARWAALTALFLAALPALFLAGLLVFHLGLRAAR